jgi:cell division protein FtsB
MEWFWSQNIRKITQKNDSRVLWGESAEEDRAGSYDRVLRMRSRSIFLFSLSAAAQDGVVTKVLAAVAAVVAAAACFRRLRAQLAATTREIDELRDKLAQQQAPPAPPAPVAQAK